VRSAYLIRTAVAVLLLALGSHAPAGGPSREKPQVLTIIVFGNDACPQGADGEIVVCARQPESERYRIPKSLREHKAERMVERSWASRVQTLDDVSRVTMPNSCSVVGTGGQTGCTAKMLQQWFAERRQAENAKN
jgi:hypothetical protein